MARKTLRKLGGGNPRLGSSAACSSGSIVIPTDVKRFKELRMSDEGSCHAATGEDPSLTLGMTAFVFCLLISIFCFPSSAFSACASPDRKSVV